MKKIIVTVPLLLVSTVGCIHPVSGGDKNEGILRLAIQPFYEPKYQDNAFSMYVPAGWESSGGITFGPAPVLAYNLFCEVSDQAGKKGMYFTQFGENYIWPTERAGALGQMMTGMQGQNYYGSVVRPIESPTDYYENNIHPINLKRFNDFRISDIRQNPEKSNNLYQSAMRDPELAMLVSAGFAQLSYELIEVDATATKDGEPIDVHLEYAFQYMIDQKGFMKWGLSVIYGSWAKSGALPECEPMWRVLLASFQYNPAWLVKVERHRAELARIAFDELEYNRKVAESIYRNKEASLETAMKNYSEAFREISDYKDPFSGEVRMLQNTYDHIWMNSSGEVIMTDLSVNPNEEPGYKGHEWRKVTTRP